MEWTEVNRSCRGFVTPVVGDVETCKTNSAASPGKVPTDGLVFVLVTFIIKATFVKQHSKSMGHQFFIASC